MKFRRTRKSATGYLFDIINYFILGLFMLVCLYPFYYVIIYSLSNPVMDLTKVFLWPVGFSLTTYHGIFSLNDIFGALFISVARTILGTIITVACSSFFAYIIIQKKLYFRKVLYRFLIITMYFNAGLIPWYITMKTYGLKNNFLLYILGGAVSAFFVILVKTYLESLPPSLEESAKIDGAGIFTIYAKIIVPLSTPILATIAVYAAVGQWNSWNDNFFLVNDSRLQTIQLILYNYLNTASQIRTNMTTQDIVSSRLQNLITPQTVRMSITVICTVPIMLVYPFLQKFFVKGIMMGAVKG